MKLNRQGITRLVIELDKVVIKIPNFTYSWKHFIQGLLCNMQEKTHWEVAAYTEWQHVLCPVLWTSWGGWILIMRKIRILTEEEYKVADISEHLKYFAGDDKAENYGWFNNKLVKVDYGQ